MLGILLLGALLLQGAGDIASISFQGVETFSEREVRSVVGVEKGAVYNYPILKSGLFKLRQFYRRKGFFDFRILDETIEETPQGIRIGIEVREGPRKLLSDIVFRGSEVFEPPFLRKIFGLKTPRPYDEDLFGRGEYDIISLYEERGYAYAELHRDLETRPGDTLWLVYTVHEGPGVTIRKIRVKGRKSVRPAIIDRELALKPGDPYSTSRISESVSRIYSTGLFTSVRYTLDPITEIGDTVDLVFIVEETRPRTLDLSFGYHTPLDLEGKFGIGHLNLFNNGQRVRLETALLYDFEAFERRRVDITYSEPYLLGFRVEGALHPYYYRDLEEEIEELGADFLLTKIVTRNLKLIGAVGWKKVLLSPEEDHGVTNTVLLQPVYDSRDNIFEPRRGSFTSLRLENAGWVLAGTNDFRRVFFDFSTFRWFRVPNEIFAFRARFGMEWPYGRSETIPVEERFLLGGEGSLRGYDRRTVGPPDPERAFRSGTYLLNGSFEVREYLFFPFGFVLFVDAGMLWDRTTPFADSPLELGAGIGLRYSTPVGPIRFDWGLRLRDREENEYGRLYLGIGQMF
jgi:outer membrane protein insertion porin family